jgi:hypothetical protein
MHAACHPLYDVFIMECPVYCNGSEAQNGGRRNVCAWSILSYMIFVLMARLAEEMHTYRLSTLLLSFSSYHP